MNNKLTSALSIIVLSLVAVVHAGPTSSEAGSVTADYDNGSFNTEHIFTPTADESSRVYRELMLADGFSARSALGQAGLFREFGTQLTAAKGYNAADAATTATISGVTQSGTGPITVTATTHGFLTGDVVTIASVGGATEANGFWMITKTSANAFTLDGSDGTSITEYTSGGTATLSEYWLAPASDERYVVNSIRGIFTRDDAVVAMGGFPAAALTNGFTLSLQNDRTDFTTAATGADGRTALKTFTPYAVTALEDLMLMGDVSLLLNSTDTAIGVEITFDPPLIIYGDQGTTSSDGQYLAIKYGDNMGAFGKFTWMASGFIYVR